MTKHNYLFGSVSNGTMRPEDLFEAFAGGLQSLSLLFPVTSGLSRFDEFKREHRDVFEIEDYYEMTEEQQESLDYAVGELSHILNDYAAPYFYFGTLNGEGSDYGFWFDEDSFNEAVRSGEILKVDELPEDVHPEDGFEYVAVISDHGNITLYDREGEEVWAIS